MVGIGRIKQRQNPYEMGNEINRLYRNDECKVIMPYGGLGYGKSALAFKVGAEVLGTLKEPDYETLKDYIVFHPQDFLDISLNHRGMEKFIIWDDAGVWLHALDYNHPFVKAVGRYLSVARTDWAALILTTPLPTWIANKVRSLPDAITVKIIKTANSKKNWKYKYRLAKAFRFWVLPDLKKTGVNPLWEDEFSAMLPDEFYKWYKPLRDKYALMAKQIMAAELKRLMDDHPEYNWENVNKIDDSIEKSHLKKFDDKI